MHEYDPSRPVIELRGDEESTFLYVRGRMEGLIRDYSFLGLNSEQPWSFTPRNGGQNYDYATEQEARTAALRYASFLIDPNEIPGGEWWKLEGSGQ